MTELQLILLLPRHPNEDYRIVPPAKASYSFRTCVQPTLLSHNELVSGITC